MKLNATYSLWSKINFGAPQGSKLKIPLFIIFLCDLFQFFPDLRSWTGHGKATHEWHSNDIRVHTSDIRMTYEYIRVHTADTQVHTSDIRMTYEYILVHTSNIRMIYKYIRVTYGWHMSTYEYIWVTYGWHTSAYEWHTDDIHVHTSDIRMTDLIRWFKADQFRKYRHWHQFLIT